MRLPSSARPWLVWSAGFLALFGPVVVKLVRDWADNPDYAHGFIVVPAAALLAWHQRSALRATERRPSASGLAIVAGSIAVFLVGQLAAELFLPRLALVGVIAGTVVFAFGWPMLRAAAFPIGFLLLMIPPPTIVFNRIAIPLQLWASEVGALLLRASGVPVLREGNVLVLANVTLQVSEACSGIRSLMSLGTFAILFAYVSERRQLRRVLLALMSVPIAVGINAFRVALTGVAAAHYGRDAAEGVLHAVTGWGMFMVALVLLFALGRLAGRFASPQPAIAGSARP